jgi:nucleotide-binding universal stress UspA family protein
MAQAIPASPLPQVQNILFATDFSLIAQRALPYAYAIAKRFGATLHLVHVVGPERIIGPLGTPYSDSNQEEEEESARHQLSELTEAAPLNHLRHFSLVCRGEVPNLVSRLISEWNIDLVVLGTHGRHGFKQLMLGSVAEQIFRRATCPVLTVGPTVPQEALPSGRFSKILLATDLSLRSADVLKYALSIARANSSTLILFHAISEEELRVRYGNRLHDAFVEVSARLAVLLVPDSLGLTHETVVRRGDPAHLIVHCAAETQADLIIMGAHRGATVAAHLPQAIAHVVVCEAPCPVITVGHR